jgi:subtilisin family serine protease
MHFLRRSIARVAVRTIALSSLTVFALACADQQSTPPTAPSRAMSPSAPSFVRATQAPADHVLIETKGPASAAFSAAVTALGGQVERRLSALNTVVVRGLSPAAAATLSARSDVAHLTPDVRIRWIPATTLQRSGAATQSSASALPHVDQSSAFFFDTWQWNMRVTKANQAWLTTPEGNGARVYVLDTGIDPTHIDLKGRVDLVTSASFAEAEPNDIRDFESHGTFVSAIITSNGIGVASVAPLAKITAVKVLDASGSGSFADVIAGILYAADKHADVINMSLGAIIDSSADGARGLLDQLQRAINIARSRGVVVIAAAGNEGIDLTAIPPQFLSVPAEMAGVIAVGATAPVNRMHYDMLASYSNFGWNGAPVGGVPLFAPGGDLVQGGVVKDLIISACSQFSPFGCGPADFLIGAGTSFASPMVAGEGAVLRSIVGASGSLITNSCLLLGTDEIGPPAIFGHGRMNVVKAAACASNSLGGNHALIASTN